MRRHSTRQIRIDDGMGLAHGLVLYRTATGELPFRGKDVRAVLDSVQQHRPPPPHELLPVALASCVATIRWPWPLPGASTFSAPPGVSLSLMCVASTKIT